MAADDDLQTAVEEADDSETIPGEAGPGNSRKSSGDSSKMAPLRKSELDSQRAQPGSPPEPAGNLIRPESGHTSASEAQGDGLSENPSSSPSERLSEGHDSQAEDEMLASLLQMQRNKDQQDAESEHEGEEARLDAVQPISRESTSGEEGPADDLCNDLKGASLEPSKSVHFKKLCFLEEAFLL